MIERALKRQVSKPWGVIGRNPWLPAGDEASPVGELWFELGRPSRKSALLLKLLMTSQPLSIQVHPDDAMAHAIGLPRGKSEAWYVLHADAGAKVGVGLTEAFSPERLRSSVTDGTIGDLLVWHTAAAGDVFNVPAGTIHAIGSGLVIAEIQQNSSATFRLLDYGRERELQIESGLAAANVRPAEKQVHPKRLSHERLLLVANSHFIFERLDVPAGSTWRLEADCETWLVALDGSAIAGSFELAIGDAIFARDASLTLCVGGEGLRCLVAYLGGKGPHPRLLRRVE